MTYLLHKSGIITGRLSSYCLACECSLESEDYSHLKTSSHTKQLAAVPYCEQFKDQHIRKFKTGYFCEFCNLLMPTAMKVNMHIEEENHKQNRGCKSLKYLNCGVIAYNNVCIQENAWHSFVEDMCSVCDAEFDDENDHKKDTNHILRLIQKHVTFGPDNAIYRQIDDSTVQCLICNVLLASSAANKHFTDIEHQELYAKCKIVANGHDEIRKEPNVSDIVDKNETKTEAKIIHDNVPTKQAVGNKNNVDETPKVDVFNILHSAARFQSKGVDVFLDSEFAYCRKCCVDVNFNYDDIEKHVEGHSKENNTNDRYPLNKDNTSFKLKEKIETARVDDDDDSENNKVNTKESIKNDVDTNEDSGNISDDTSSTCDVDDVEYEQASAKDIKQFAKDNKITYNDGHGSAFCRICQVKLPSPLKCMKEHVEGNAHKKNIARSESKQSTSAVKTVRSETFIRSLVGYKHPISHDYLINHELCIDRFSFLLVTKNTFGLRCLLCEVNFPPFEWALSFHLRNGMHGPLIENAPVVTTVKSEFIREIKPGVFHCGYCHLVVGSWSDMECHLNTSDHADKKREQHFILHFLHN
ncbi:uncharacterized protein LOC142983530 [Anticarsia gemmatalis]|uniref:uncharacterized protein LOC142983530 n=1 Tax=Anticarsia gemmatalis TaxID=129554 RepID=UPI003F772950